MKKKIASVICLIVALCLCLAIAMPAIFGVFASADELQDKYNQNNAEKNKIQQQLNQKKSERKAKEAEKDRIDNEIATLNSQIDSLNRKINTNKAEIAQKEAEIEEVEDKIEESDELLKMRLRVMYEKGSVSYLEILFSATSFSDLMVRADMVQQLMAHDNALIAQLQEKKGAIQESKAAIEEIQAENEQAKAAIAEQRKTLDAKSEKSLALINELRSDEAYLEEQYEQRQRENEAILREIRAATQGSSNAQAATYSGGQLGWPSTLRGTITSEFGSRTLRGKPDNHTGIDIAVPMGTPVLACEDGVVLSSGWRNGGYGNCITISHGSITTLYAHNSVLQVSAGQTVKRGQQIALAGSTGNSTGPHIHLGVINNSTGKYENPRPYIF